ncbi:MAG: glycosyltransferase family 4 protein [Chloroflexaceae bacterium]|nr:glycosyltransferase family 4 protein [Chloroflexaceae bacterium]
MTILYAIPRYDSAAMGNRIHAEVIECWREHGVQSEVLSLDARLRRLTTTIEDGITVHRLPVSSNLLLKGANRALGVPFHYPYLAGALAHYRRFLASRRYELVHVETAFPLGLVAGLLPRRASPPLAVTLPGADIMAEPEYDYGYARFGAVRAALPFVYRRAALLRADSPQIRELAIRQGAAPHKVTAIPYNISADSYPAPGTDVAALRATSRAELVARHQLDPDRPIVVSLSRLHPFKGVAYLLESLPHVQQAGLWPQLLVVGPAVKTRQFGDYGEYLRRKMGTLGVGSNVILTGALEHSQVRAYLAAADVVVVPSVAESFNRVTVEAAAVGTPVVVTRTTGVSAYVAEAESGLVVEPRSAGAIAQALCQLLSDQALWQRCHSRAVPMAAQFRSEAIAAALLELYRPIFGREV